MSYATHFASIRDDHGMASELVHVSPIFARCGPCQRGEYADRREARTWRTDARRARRAPVAEPNLRTPAQPEVTEIAAAGFRRAGRL